MNYFQYDIFSLFYTAKRFRIILTLFGCLMNFFINKYKKENLHFALFMKHFEGMNTSS